MDASNAGYSAKALSNLATHRALGHAPRAILELLPRQGQLNGYHRGAEMPFCHECAIAMATRAPHGGHTHNRHHSAREPPCPGELIVIDEVSFTDPTADGVTGVLVATDQATSHETVISLAGPGDVLPGPAE